MARDPNLDFSKGTALANEVLIDIGDGVSLSLAHFRPHTVTLRPGQAVRRGDLLGLVGNSGQTSWPHLHMSFRERRDVKVTLPVALANIRVGLNPGKDDPWVRQLQGWEIREGYFVERAE